MTLSQLLFYIYRRKFDEIHIISHKEAIKTAKASRYVRHIQSTLTDIHRLRERRFKYADYGACDTLLDLDKAIKNAVLTDKQREVLYLLYERDMTQVSVADKLGIAQRVVSHHNKYAIKKIAREYGGGTREITREGNGRDKENAI